MLKVDDTIKNAIIAAVTAKGSRTKVANEARIADGTLSRYLKGQVSTINTATWNSLMPVIKDYLPEEYHCLFPQQGHTESTANLPEKQEINMESLLEFGKNDRRTVLMTMLRMILPDLSINGLRSVTLHAETVFNQERDPVLIQERIKHAEAELERQEALLKQLVPISDQFGKNVSQVQYSITVTEVNIRDLQERIRNWKELTVRNESCDMSHLN